MTTTDSNTKIEKRAHELWEAEGCPEGRELDFWLQAERELAVAPKAAPAGSSDGETEQKPS
jgi:Protein of unknown function (DUF2934)